MRSAVYIDANVLIAAFEMSGLISDHVWQIFAAVDNDVVSAVTSELTLAEVLPKPIAFKDNDLIRTYESLISSGGSLEVAPVDRRVLWRSAQIRAVNSRVRLPDAIHLATALERGCPAFLTSDLRMRTPLGIQVVRLSPNTLGEIRKLTS